MIKKAIFLAIITLFLIGCASNEHLVFFTNTSIGLDIGSEPNTGTPVKFVLGYKRQEGVIDPIMTDYEFYRKQTSGKAEAAVATGNSNAAMLATAGKITPAILASSGSDQAELNSEKEAKKTAIVGTTGTAIKQPINGDTRIVMTSEGTAIPKGSTSSVHSVLAKMNFGSSSGNVNAAASQWFATGRAAELVAQAPGLSGALTGDPKNNVNTNINIDEAESKTAVFGYLQHSYDLLEAFVDDNPGAASEAIAVKNNVDKLDKDIFKQPFVYFNWVNKGEIVIDDYPVKADEHVFSNIVQYINNIDTSYKTAKEAVLIKDIKVSGKPITAEQRKKMLEAVEHYKKRYDSGVKIITSSQEVIKMLEYLHTDILLTKAETTNGE